MTDEPRTRGRLAGLLLVVLTVATYLPALQNGFVWDDDHYVTDNLELRSLAGLSSAWFTPGASGHLYGQYYPLVQTSFWIEHQLWGGTPLGYHVVNVLLHALTALLLWRLLLRLSVPGAWCAAAVFALHPVQVESVAWITERKNVLSGALAFGAALAWLSFAGLDARRPAAAGRGRWYALAFVLYLGALLSKTVTCTLPFALLLLLWWRRGRVGWRDAARLLPFVLAGAALGLLTAQLERTAVGAVGKEWAFTPVDRVLIAARALWFYAGKLAWPSSLTFIYPRWELDAGAWTAWAFLAAALAVVGGLWLARRQLGRGPLVTVLLFAGTLTPALGFVNVYPMRYSFVADHFQYLASAALIAGAVAALAPLARRLGPRAAAVPAAALLGALALLSWRQQGDYRDAETLWRATIDRNPACWMAWNNLGMEVARQGRLPEAVADFEQSLRLNPAHQQAHSNLGYAELQQGRVDEAIAHYEAALAIDPDYSQAHGNLAVALERKGRLPEALVHFGLALQSAPDDAELHFNYGLALAQAGRVGDAIAEDERAVALRPDYAEAHNNLANVLMQAGRGAEALAHYEQAVALAPDYAEAHANLGHALLAAGRTADAIGHYERALALRPDFPGVDFLLGAALAQAGRNAEAITHDERALQLDPGSAEAHYNLALVLAAQGRTGEAIAHDEAAVRLADWPEARVNLANLLLAAGRVDEAIEQLQAALATRPALPAARFLLGEALAQAGRPAEAIPQFRQGLAARPDDVLARCGLGLALAATGDAAGAAETLGETLRRDSGCVPALDRLAWIRATAADDALRDGAEAVRLAERACELTGRAQATCLDTLAAAYAETGRFAEAIATAQAAQALAAAQPSRLAALAARIERYRAGQPWREPAAPVR